MEEPALPSPEHTSPQIHPPARLLDLTRLIRRAGRRPTGIDRVELAYLHHLLRTPVPLFALARSAYGYVLLDATGIADIAARLDGTRDWGRADLLSRLARHLPPQIRRAESDLRRAACARCRPMALARMLRRHLPDGFAYLNVGHSNLSARTLRGVRRGGAGRIAVLVHDVIPLEFPQYQRPGTPDIFHAMLGRVRTHADLIIYNSADTCTRAEQQMSAWGPVPAGVIAHLGVPRPLPGKLPPGIDPARAYFVVLGTIEPRKGHDLLLDLWDEMGEAADRPGLILCGARGWANEAVFNRLDRLPHDSPIREMSGLSDEQIAALLIQSRGLLFPSHAEGYGLPPIEAVALGVPVISNDLPSIREILGNIPVYVKDSERYQWLSAVKALSMGPGAPREAASNAGFVPPSWEDHFNIVLRLT
ncbi:glycosyltransferase [Antarcticimicrobium sediminis]|uniref:Glycosyltransferase family 1 protein n=1 Tax=Antarcticimicrobium sediminis TaxID=2546227 RepID=A0A4R5EQH1_9RHOB|nr:glycosyltransferase [Antarcticimicrobium sediminis]TDE37065.1 glycosyltransferase family 1 protein [Antarcticimicrobium sediminis]